MNSSIRIACLIFSALLSACSTVPEKTSVPITALLSPTAAQPPYSRQDQRIGVALAGGGTKAASYGMGVLAGLADEGMYDKVEAISTVSGGGYAAFFLYSKLLASRDLSPKPDPATFFKDCLPSVYKDVLPASAKSRRCDQATAAALEEYRFQQFVRCRQDVLENDCNQELGGTDHSEITNTVGLAVSTVLAFVPNFTARTVFDWPLNLSPSRQAYMNGIGTAFGLYPLKAEAAANSPDLRKPCAEGLFLNCETTSGHVRLDRSKLHFQDLAAYLKESAKFPTWIINATASRSRSLFGWARAGQRDFTQYTMQMSPFGARSGFHGAVDNYAAHLDLLNATTAAAAFLDSNETALGQPWRMLGAVSQHLTAFDWGIDIPNPNVGSGWRALHNVLPLWPWPWTTVNSIPTLPIPLYWADGGMRQLGDIRKPKPYRRSAYIRLIDGGNNDDLGAYTLIDLGVKQLIISDHAYDGKGDMQDLCRLHNEIRLRKPGKELVVPGLEEFAEHCLQFVSESECPAGPCKTVPGLEKLEVRKGRYPIMAWPHEVLLGCVRDQVATGEPGTDCKGTLDTQTQIYILKPALAPGFTATYLPGGKVNDKACPTVARIAGDKDDKDLGPCEAAAFIAMLKHEGKKPGPFPQHTTVGMTFASTAREYGAYRELARFQMRKALRMIERGRSEPGYFGAEATKQKDKFVHLPLEK